MTLGISRVTPVEKIREWQEELTAWRRDFHAYPELGFEEVRTSALVAERLASWVGICPGNHESAGKRKSGRTRKGNAWVRRLLCEFAQAASRTRCALKDKFSALSIRKGHKRSIVALAHKMLRIVYAMLNHATPYQDRNVDYEALVVQRNAPRWLKMLEKHFMVLTLY
jgi:hypothetical protein